MADTYSAELEVDRITKRFGQNVIVSDVSFSLPPGEFVSLLGASGCGKTTTLSMIAGFERPDSGRIVVKGKTIDAQPPERRNVGMVFQSYALFPHLTIAQNIGFGLRMRRLDKPSTARRVGRVAELVKVGHLLDRYPRSLSGGQQQRVSLARALVLEPAIMLLDEPFGALDRQLREEFQIEIRALLRRLEITTLFVTHDQDEALSMSDRVAVMHAGQIEQIAEPRILYEMPSTINVAGFVGRGTFLTGVVQDAPLSVAASVGRLKLNPEFGSRIAIGQEATLFLRPEAIKLLPDSRDPLFKAAAIVVGTVFHGDRQYATVDTAGGQQVVVGVDRNKGLRLGNTVSIGWNDDDGVVFQGGKRV